MRSYVIVRLLMAAKLKTLRSMLTSNCVTDVQPFLLPISVLITSSFFSLFTDILALDLFCCENLE